MKLSWSGYAVLSLLSRIFLANSLKDYNKFEKCFKKLLHLIPTLFLNSFTPISFNTPLPIACPNSQPNFSSSTFDASCTSKPEPFLYRDLQMLNSTFLPPLHSLIPFTKLRQKSSRPPPASRLAILRWSIDSEPDVHFRIRRHISRPSPCRCGCGSISSLYPEGLQHGSISSHHLHLPHTWRTFLPPSLPPPFANISHRPDPPALPPAVSVTWRARSGDELTSLESLPAALTTWVTNPCVLCGHGDNSVQHWLYFCPVPALAGTLLLRLSWKTSFWFLHHSLSYTQLAQRSALWVSTRQFVHERSGLPPPSLHSPALSLRLYFPNGNTTLTARHFFYSIGFPPHPSSLRSAPFSNRLLLPPSPSAQLGEKAPPPFMVMPLFCIPLTLKGPVLAPIPCTHPLYENCLPSKNYPLTFLTAP